jgi:transcriptional regulator with XRE-family HTH domain
MSLDYKRLGAFVAQARQDHDWRQSDLAEAASVSLSTVQNIETGRPFRRFPSSYSRIERVLGVAPGGFREILQDPTSTVSAHRNTPSTPRPALSTTRESSGATDTREGDGQTSDTMPTPVSARDDESLIDPDSPDPIIRELSVGPAASAAYRELLIQIHLEEKHEYERRALERARYRALLAQAAEEGLLNLDAPDIAERIRRLSPPDSSSGTEQEAQNPGEQRNTA